MSQQSYANREQLPGILLGVHRRTCLATLRGVGVEINDWDNEAVSQLVPARLNPNINLADVFYTDERHAAHILGYTCFRLDWSGSPLHLLEAVDASAERNDMTLAVDKINVPSKFVSVLLSYEDSSLADEATIFVGPDTPPVAVLREYLEPEADHLGIEADDPSLVSYIGQLLGEYAVDYLSEEACAALGHALLTAETTNR